MAMLVDLGAEAERADGWPADGVREQEVAEAR